MGKLILLEGRKDHEEEHLNETFCHSERREESRF